MVLKTKGQLGELEERGESVSILTWEEYLSDDLVANFERELGCLARVSEITNSEELVQILSERPADFDVVIADEQTLDNLARLKLLGDIAPETYRKVLATTDQRFSSVALPQEATVPYLWGLTVLVGREEVLREDWVSWKLLWREDLRVALLDEPTDLIWIALLALDRDPAKATAADIQEAADRLGKRFPRLVDHMFDPLAALDALEAGKVDLVVTYNGDALLRAATNPGIRVRIPEEGAPLWIDSFAITRDAPNPELAQRFIEFMSRPENSAESSETLHYATPNLLAKERLPSPALSNPLLYPDEATMEKCRFVSFRQELMPRLNQTIAKLLRSPTQNKVALTPGNEEEKPPFESED